ncbi:MAG: DNA cytosine methyltransferase [Lachnospiraceae bacterium]|nr:DNA cytosine methyltransferase [Lachnospiraceae bacterium]
MMDRYQVVHLFAGIGGMAWAFREAGFAEYKMAGVEENRDAGRIFKENLEAKLIEADDRTFSISEIPDMEILTGTIPAAEFRQKEFGLDKDFPADERKWAEEMASQVLKEKRPQAFFFEKRLNRRENPDEFVSKLQESEYQAVWQCVDMGELGGLSGRYLYVMGMRCDRAVKLENPKLTGLWNSAEEWIDFQMKREDASGGGRRFADVLPYKRGAVYSWQRNGYQQSDAVSWNPRMVPLVCDDTGIRKISVRELQRLKGFPDEFRLSGSNQAVLQKYLIHASNVRICRQYAECLRDYLEGKKVVREEDAGERLTSKAEIRRETETVMGRKKKCFVIMPFEKKLDECYSKLIKPTVENCGYEVKRADEIYGTNAIIDDITKEIKEADLLIADATGKNPNVNYELGYSHALEKQVIIITQQISDIPFDYRHRRAIVYDTSEFEWKKKLENHLMRTIKALEQ